MSLEFIHTEENGIKYLIHPPGSIFAGIKMRENHEDAFDNAIKRGMKNPENWMYMYSENPWKRLLPIKKETDCSI